MRLFVIVYADDLKSACTTTPLSVSSSTTIRDFKIMIEKQIRPTIESMNQVLSLMRNGVIVRFLD